MRALLHRYALLLGLFVLFGPHDAWAQTLTATITANGINPATVAQGASVVLQATVQNTANENNDLTTITRTVTNLPTGLAAGAVVFGGEDAAGASYNPANGTVMLSNIVTLSNRAAARITTITFNAPATFTARFSTTADGPRTSVQSVTVNVTTTAAFRRRSQPPRPTHGEPGVVYNATKPLLSPGYHTTG